MIKKMRCKKQGRQSREITDKFKIQMLSALQHTWSVIFHDMGYKSDFDVPRQIVRDYSRLPGLLELANERFVHIRNYMGNYTAEVKNKIAENQGDELKIDMVTLREYMHQNLNMQSLLAELALISGQKSTLSILRCTLASWLGSAK